MGRRDGDVLHDVGQEGMNENQDGRGADNHADEEGSPPLVHAQL